MVEMGALGAALLLAPHELWDPVPEPARARLVSWLSAIDSRDTRPNNWLFFRSLVDLGLRRIGAREVESDAARSDLDSIDELYLGHGWYEDGRRGPVDWYVPFAFHFYGLVYAGSRLGESSRAGAYRERAAAFADEHARWFAPNGAALAFGRSLTYRFAQAAFWGALAFAGVEALPWGQIKTLYLGNLRHWRTMPIADRDGVLSVGYANGSRRIAESYSSAGSPYWAFKAFLPLALPADHPFWIADEEPLASPTKPSVQLHAGKVLTSDESQVLAISATDRIPSWVEHAGAKYGRFAYSSLFGLCIDAPAGRDPLVCDSTLVLADANGDRRARAVVSEIEFVGDLIASLWTPWPGVVVDTILWCRAPWHVRIHLITTERPIDHEEWGFAAAIEPSDDGSVDVGRTAGHGYAMATTAQGISGIRDLSDARLGRVARTSPGAAIGAPLTIVPALAGSLQPGSHTFTTLVFGSPPRTAAAWSEPPEMPPSVLALAAQRAEARTESDS
jgi:hypothetical protein